MLLVVAFLLQELVVFLKFKQAAFLFVVEMPASTLNLPPRVPYPLNILLELFHGVLEEGKLWHGILIDLLVYAVPAECLHIYGPINYLFETFPQTVVDRVVLSVERVQLFFVFLKL